MNEKLSVNPSSGQLLTMSHVRCIAHAMKLEVKESLDITTENIHRIRGIISSMRSFLKRRDIFEKLKVELGLPHALVPGLDVPTW